MIGIDLYIGAIMAKEMSACDGRRYSNRIQRVKFQCTCCGTPLPKSRRDWGLVWESNHTGMCIKCLQTIRKDIGVTLAEQQ